jgi:hypothetical protein
MNPANNVFLYPKVALQIGVGYLIQKRINYEYEATQACSDLYHKIQSTLEKCFSAAATVEDPADALKERLICYESASWGEYEDCIKNAPYFLAPLIIGVAAVAAFAFFRYCKRPEIREA